MGSWVVPPRFAGTKLIQFLSEQLKQRTVRSIKRAIESNLCRVNGRPERYASVCLRSGDQIVFSEDSRVPTPLVIAEDAHFLICNKPSGIVCDRKGILRFYPRSLLVHRLDRETSGVMILAHCTEIKEKFVELFRLFQVKKTYDALVEGKVRKKRGRIENYLGCVYRRNGQTTWGEVLPPRGKRAETSWEIRGKGARATWLTCSPKTGRTHQLRAHLLRIGHPIVGDRHYCLKPTLPSQAQRVMLHATSLSFPHPLTGEKMCYTAPLPPDFLRVKRELIG